MTNAERDRIDALRLEIKADIAEVLAAVRGYGKRVEDLEDERIERVAKAKQRAAIINAIKWIITTGTAVSGVIVLLHL